MKRQILHTPEGVRDIYGSEYKKKLVLEERLQKVLRLYGYQDIQTPTFEYFDVFSKEVGTTPSRELYKFFDKEGETLVLRPDFTPSIARVATTVLDSDGMPIRLCYKGNTFTNQSSYQGRLRETTQLGAELIGLDSAEADAEMIALAVQGLREAGLTDFQIHIGNVQFFEGLMRETELSEEDTRHLRGLIKNRNYFGVDELLERMQSKVTVKTALQKLPELVGGAEVLKEAKQIALNTDIFDAVERLEAIYQILVSYGVEGHITFDLSMSGTYGYYTGIIFRAYTYGTGNAIVKGGRYDNLLGKFGKDLPSIGFVIVADELLSAFHRQKIEIPYPCKNSFVLYEEDRITEAISLAKEFRSSGKQTVLTKKRDDKSPEDYMQYARENGCISMVYLKAGIEMEMINLVTGTRKIVAKKIK